MSDPSPSRAASRRRLLSLVLALPAGLLVAEGVVRILGLEAMPLAETEGTTLRPVDDPIQRFETRPGAEQRVMYRERSDQPPRVVVMRVNEDGFRGPRLSKRRAGRVRLVCLGDSHTFGYGVGEGETWPDHLRRILGATTPPAAVDIVNAGVNAYDTRQELLHLERSVLRIEPNVVILQVYVNDTAIRGGGDARPDPIVTFCHPRRPGTVATLRGLSRLADVTLDRIYRRRSLAVYARERMASYDEESAGWRAMTDALRRMRELLDARGVTFGVALFPFLVRDGDRLTSHEAFGRVKTFLDEEEIPYLDPEPAFLATDVDALRISDQDYHANGEGYRLFAHEVAAWIRRQGWHRPAGGR